MAPVTETCSLELGIVVDSVAHTSVVLRAARLADAYAAAAATPIPAGMKDDASAGVAYQMAIEDAGVLSQIVRFGSLDPVPSIPALVAEIDPDDMAALRQAAARLKKKLRLSKSILPPTDAPNMSSSEPATV